jgi:hypothetical protein
VERVRMATLEELKAVPGITEKAAGTLWRTLHAG